MKPASLMNPFRNHSRRRTTETSSTRRARLALQHLEDRVTPTAIPAPPGLVSWWPGDGDTLDIVGGNHGTLQNGANYQQGHIADGFNFDGIDDWVAAPSVGLPTGSADRTMELWVRIDSESASESCFAAYGSAGTGNAVYYLGLKEDHRLMITTWYPAIFGPVIQEHQWHHVAATNVGSSFKLYLDGAEVASGDMPVNTPAGSTTYMGRLGPGGIGDFRRLDGSVDELSIYNRALTGAEIQSIYLAGRDGKIKPYMVINDSTPAGGDTVTTPILQFDVDFNYPVLASSIQATDFTVNGIPANTFTLEDADTIRFRYATSPLTGGGAQTMSMPAGAVQALGGVPNPSLRAWSETFGVPSTFIVTNALDGPVTGSGQLPGSLRQAIFDANASPGTDAIAINSGLSTTLTNGEIAITESVAIQALGAAGASVNGNNASRIFNVNVPASAYVSISGLTLTGGNAGDGGAISLSGSLTIANCAIDANNATNSDYAHGGGAIYMFQGAHLTVSDSTLNNNNAGGVGGAVFVSGDGSVTIMNSTVSGNTCGTNPSSYGDGGGGGIYFANRGQLLMVNCTVSGNTSTGIGGGLYFGSAIATSNSWIIKNSTISGNSSSLRGGGIGFQCRLDTLQIQNSTITGNSAVLGGGIEISNNNNLGQDVNLESTIVSGNSGGAAPDINSPSASPPNVITATNSAIGSPSGFTLSPNSSGNLPFGATLNLGPLQNNGGSTQTHALLLNSPCINAGENPAGLATDQRGPGYLRVVGSAADIGAFEVQATAPSVLGTQINDGSAQRSRVTSLTVTFSTAVTFAGAVADAFTLTRNGNGKPVSFVATANVVNGFTVVTLSNFTGSSTQFGSLADGRYTLTALSSQISANGTPLDGDGDGQPGGNYTFGDAQGLFRFFGDINGDRHVDIADFGLLSSTFNLHTGQTGFIAAFDFNGDGVIDIADFGQFSVRLFTPLP